MDAMTGRERALASWLEDAGPDDVPGRVVAAALAQARRVRQRPPWLTSIWWTRWPRAWAPGCEALEGLPLGPALRPPFRLVWVLVALAALLALLGALFASGTIRLDHAPALAACPAGSSPDVRGPIDQARPPEVRWAAWDPVDGRSIVAVAVDEQDRASTWRFDVCTNTWRSVTTSGTPGGPAGDGVLVSDVDSGRLLFVRPEGVSSFDPYHDLWGYLGWAPVSEGSIAAAYDPVTGRVVVFGPDRLAWSYDVESGSWEDMLVRGAPWDPISGQRTAALAYDSQADRFVLVVVDAPATARTWELDPRARRWIDPNANDTVLNLGYVNREDFLVYDEHREQVLAFGVDTVAAYDPRTTLWRGLAGGGVDGHWAAKAYDPLNGRVVAFPMGGMAPTHASRQFRWTGVGEPVAFDLATGTWRALLDPAP